MNKQILKDLFDNNRNLLERVKKEQASFSYLKEDDVLLVNIGRRKLSVGVNVDDNLIVHYDPKTYKIVGFTIPFYKNWLKENKNKARNNKIEEEENRIDTIASSSMSRLSFC